MFAEIATIDRLMWFMAPVGFFIVGGYGTFAAYPPELFPTRMRATGEDFCWNMARILTAMGRFGAGVLVGIFGSVPSAGIAVAAVYIVGAVAIWFGPENEGPRDRSLSGDADMICKDLAKPRSRPQSPAPPISSSMPIPSFSSTRWH